MVVSGKATVQFKAMISWPTASQPYVALGGMMDTRQLGWYKPTSPLLQASC